MFGDKFYWYHHDIPNKVSLEHKTNMENIISQNQLVPMSAKEAENEKKVEMAIEKIINELWQYCSTHQHIEQNNSNRNGRDNTYNVTQSIALTQFNRSKL